MAAGTLDKAGWRRWARRRVDPASAARLSPQVVEGLRHWLPREASVLMFLPMEGEVDLSTLPPSGRWLVTRTPPRGPLTVHRLDAPRERHRYGFEQPIAGAPPADLAGLDVVLVPGVAFDRAGTRLGHGMGYYDELLSRLPPGIARVGVTFDALIVDRLPAEPHDVAMTHLASESGVVTVDTVDDVRPTTP